MLRRINNSKVNPVKIPHVDKTKIKGHDMFGELHANIFICSKKKTGKSSLVWNILKNCSGKKTKIIIISPSVEKDPTYRHIVKHFEKKGNDVITFHSIKEDGQDNLREVMDTINKEDLDDENEKEKDEEKPQPQIVTFQYGSVKDIEKKERKERKEKYLSPKYIFVLDDLSRELRSPTVAHLLKTNRWYHSKVIVSTQYPLDLLPESLKQFDYMLLGTNHTTDKLEQVHQRSDLALPFETFYEYYLIATEQRYSFLYIDIVNELYRKNFNMSIE